jgi:hypothetical protein
MQTAPKHTGCPLEPEPEELQSVSLVQTHERNDYRTHRGQDRRAQASAQGERRYWNVADRKSISYDPGNKLRTPSGLPVRQRICLANKGAGGREWKLTFTDTHPSQIVGCGVLDKLVQQAWEMGGVRLTLIHGHGRNPGIVHCFLGDHHSRFSIRDGNRPERPWTSVSRQFPRIPFIGS